MFVKENPDRKKNNKNKLTGLYPGELKSGINFALEPEWAHIWVGLYPGGSL